MKTRPRPTKNDRKRRVPVDQIKVSLPQLVASITRESFYEFVKEFWSSVIPEPLNDNWHIKYLCDEFQRVAERVIAGIDSPYDLLINISPGTTKSTIFSVFAAPWVWTRMASARFICGSHTYELVMDLSRKSRDVIQCAQRADGGPTYQECFPTVVLRDDQNTKEYYMNTAGGFRKSVTVGGKSPTGFHAHFLIIDDPIDPQKAVSEAELKTANQWMNETLPSRKVDAQLTPTILIMQRVHEEDPSGTLLSQKNQNVKHICLPCDDSWPINPPALKKRYVNGLMDPKRLTSKTLLQKKDKMGPYGYSGQYGQQPTPLEGGMFQVGKIKVDYPTRPMKIIYRYWDKAATEGGGAYTVGAKLGLDDLGHFWILHMNRFRWATDKREAEITKTARSDGKKVRIGIEEEGGSGGKDSARWTVKSLIGFLVTTDRPTGEKELRADALSTQVNAGNVSMVEGEWNQDMLDELKLFPMSKFKDQVDALSGAFKLITKRRSGKLF